MLGLEVPPSAVISSRDLVHGQAAAASFVAMSGASRAPAAPATEPEGPALDEVDETSRLRAQVHAMKQEMARRDAVLARTRSAADHSRAQLVESIGAVDAARAYAEERLAAALAAHEADRVSALALRAGEAKGNACCPGTRSAVTGFPSAISRARAEPQEEWSRQWIGLKLENARLRERLQECEVDKELHSR